jgi:hypothetical protein
LQTTGTIPMITEALNGIKQMSDSKLQKHSSLGRLSQSVGPKKKFESGINPYPQNTFKYAVLSGNNQDLVKRVMI